MSYSKEITNPILRGSDSFALERAAELIAGIDSQILSIDNVEVKAWAFKLLLEEINTGALKFTVQFDREAPSPDEGEIHLMKVVSPPPSSSPDTSEWSNSVNMLDLRGNKVTVQRKEITVRRDDLCAWVCSRDGQFFLKAKGVQPHGNLCARLSDRGLEPNALLADVDRLHTELDNQAATQVSQRQRHDEQIREKD